MAVLLVVVVVLLLVSFDRDVHAMLRKREEESWNLANLRPREVKR